ncbi:MAG TPA: hypothetical protein VER17_13500 [Tepidisphaeraceae bacterium]|nr:hypothetical protein [Tepidisphaeraceae bacterium]
MLADKIRELLLPVMVLTIVMAVWVVGWAQVRIQEAIEYRSPLPAAEPAMVQADVQPATGS